MEALYNPGAHSHSRVYYFMDCHDEQIGLHLMKQESTQVASIRFSNQQNKIPIPFGIVIAVTDLKTGKVVLNDSNKDSVVWFNVKHQYIVQYFGLPVCVGAMF